MKHAAPLATFVFLGLVAATASPAQAAPPKRIAVVPFTGPAAKPLQKLVTKALESKHYRVVVVAEGPAPDDGPGEDGAARTAVAESKAVGVVSGVVKKQGKVFTATILLRDGEDGGVVQQNSWTSKKGPGPMLRAVKKGMWKTFARSVQSLRAPAPPKPSEPEETPVAEATPTPARAPTPARPSSPIIDEEPPVASTARPRAPAAEHRQPAEETPVVDEEGAPSARTVGPAPIEVVVGPRLSSRSLTYRNVPGNTLSEFKTDRPSAALGFGASFFPRLGLPRLGVAIEGQYGSRVRASRGDTQSYDLRTDEVFGGALVGVPYRWIAVDLALGGGLHRSKFVPLDDASAQAPPIPDVSYRFMRVGGIFHLYTPSGFSVMAGGAYRRVLSTGAIASDDWFPYLTAYGVDGMAGASYRIMRWVEARLQVDARRYRYHMNAAEDDKRVAGGAVDAYWGAWLGVAGVFGI
ncbi:MAG TPA: hypothetical protein VN914_20790 [Polyangia bacterium]|nr:hypothetical protein [Polyangia bacterium]